MITSNSSVKTLLVTLGVFLALTLTNVRAVDWVTNDGKVYQDVSVIKVEADAVTIIYRNGGALVPLESLPVYLKQKFNYDPVKAQLAADARAKQDALDKKALQDEIDLAAKIKKEKQIAEAKAQDKASSAMDHQ